MAEDGDGGSEPHWSSNAELMQLAEQLVWDMPADTLQILIDADDDPPDGGGALFGALSSVQRPSSAGGANPNRSVSRRGLAGAGAGAADANETLLSDGGAASFRALGARMGLLMRAHRDLMPGSWLCCASACIVEHYTHNPAFFMVIVEQVQRVREARSAWDTCADENIQVRTSVLAHAGAGSEQHRSQTVAGAKAMYKEAVLGALRLLRGIDVVPGGVAGPENRVCVQGVLSLLRLSTSALYRVSAGQPSLMNRAGGRERQHRRIGSREGYPSIEDLNSVNCGCYSPCLMDTPVARLLQIWHEFTTIATSASASTGGPRLGEQQALLDVMFCPLTNSVVGFCDEAISSLYAVSVGLVRRLRAELKFLCAQAAAGGDSIALTATPRPHGLVSFHAHSHPLNRLNRSYEEAVRSGLALHLRADPGLSSGLVPHRICSPEVNTLQKLRELMFDHVAKSQSLQAAWATQLPVESALRQSGGELFSHSTMQRIIDRYLDDAGGRLSFSKSDHNCCVRCQDAEFRMLELLLRIRQLRAGAAVVRHGSEVDGIASTSASVFQQQQVAPAPPHAVDGDGSESERKANALELELDMIKAGHEEHLARDRGTRAFLGKVTVFLTNTLNTRNASLRLAPADSPPSGSPPWLSLPSLGLQWHQDDMSKLNLPNFVQETIAELQRNRYPVCAHVNTVTNDVNIYSSEMGGGSKNASSIVELIILNHVISCTGEGVLVIWSDCAAAGRNYSSCVAMSQWMIDNGLALVVLVAFFENRHGKFSADAVFGSLQRSVKSTVVPGLDAFLAQCEKLKQKKGSLSAFALNPLASVSWAENFDKLGYATKAPDGLRWAERNPHACVAAAEGARKKLDPGALELIGHLLPTHPGFVRLSYTIENVPETSLPFEKRPIDVPAMKTAGAAAQARAVNTDSVRRRVGARRPARPDLCVVSLTQPFRESGPCVVLRKTATRVGYNGLGFLKEAPELRSAAIAAHAWPPPPPSAAPAPAGTLCSPANWVLRRSSFRYSSDHGGPVARYPPANHVNAISRLPPRCLDSVRHLRTYEEDHVPVIPLTCAAQGLAAFAAFIANKDGTSYSLLDALRFVFQANGVTDADTSDPYLQRPPTVACAEGLREFQEKIGVSIRRQVGRPMGKKNAYQHYKVSVSGKATVAAAIAALSGNADMVAEKDVWKRCWAELGRDGQAEFVTLADADSARYTAEMAVYIAAAATFDKENNVCAVPQVEVIQSSR